MITVNDIREKEFGTQKHGYNEEEVDDFLDEIAEQMEALIRENRALMQQAEEAKAQVAQAERAAAQAAPVSSDEPARSEEPIADEPTYFRNLEATLRETLLSAQRIADETVAEARKKAKTLVADAEAQAQNITESAHADIENAKSELETIRKASADYCLRFKRLVKEQLHALKMDESELEDIE